MNSTLHLPLLLPAVALAFWTFVMWAWMYATRIPAIRRANMKLDPTLPRGEQMATLPAEVRWKAYAAAPGETFFYDERLERESGGVDPRGEFPVYLKSRGEKQSLLAEVRISCRENRFAILSGVYRDEARGWLANIASGEPQTPAPDSPVAILRSMLCAPSGDAG